MASQQNNSLKVFAALAVVAVVVLAFWLSGRNTEISPVAPKVTVDASPKMDNAPRPVTPQRTNGVSTNAVTMGSHPDLTQWRAELEALPKAEAVKQIRALLDSKQDAPTHLGFKLASNGWLTQAPTLRTFLLDELARLDPAAAADYSKVILASMDSPDEWAVALRNLASGDASAAGRALLQQKAQALLQYQPWQDNPSVGYLESFDVPVFMGGTNLLPTLSDMVRKQDNPAISHASFLALDRLVINSPATVLAAMESDPEWMQGRESTRADYFARADVRDPQQRQVLESYLLDPSRSPSELQTFAGIYPNANFMISQNLLTQANTPNHDSLVNRDAQSLAVVQQWMADPRFAGLTPTLQKISTRLQGFVQQANQGR